MIASGTKNKNSAKLFVRYLFGEAEGTGNGIKPFSSTGTWSIRDDIPDGNIISLDNIDVIPIDKQFIYDNKTVIIDFWKEILKENLKS